MQGIDCSGKFTTNLCRKCENPESGYLTNLLEFHIVMFNFTSRKSHCKFIITRFHYIFIY